MWSDRRLRILRRSSCRRTRARLGITPTMRTRLGRTASPSSPSPRATRPPTTDELVDRERLDRARGRGELAPRVPLELLGASVLDFRTIRVHSHHSEQPRAVGQIAACAESGGRAATRLAGAGSRGPHLSFALRRGLLGLSYPGRSKVNAPPAEPFVPIDAPGAKRLRS